MISTGLHPNFYPERIAAVIVESNAAFVSLSESAGVIHLTTCSLTQESAGNAPWALFSCLFRPWIGEARQVVSMLAAVENTVLLVLLLLACRSIRSARQSPDRLLTGAVITYTILLAVFLALSSREPGYFVTLQGRVPAFLVMLLLEASPEVRRWLGRLIPD